MHFIVRGEMLKNEDKDIRAAFRGDFEKRCTIHAAKPDLVSSDDGFFTVSIRYNTGEVGVLDAQCLLVATGVTPNSDDLGLENTDISVDKNGFIQVDEYLETGAR